MRYKAEGVPLVVFAGKEYGTGSSRDWAAKGTRLLGVRAVIAESFERIHRSNLVGMGVLPLVFAEGMSWKTLGLKGDERVSLKGLADIKPMQWLEADVVYASGETRAVPVRAAIDTFDELDYFRNGGILHYVLRASPAMRLSMRYRSRDQASCRLRRIHSSAATAGWPGRARP